MFKINCKKIRQWLFDGRITIEEFAKRAQITGLTARTIVQSDTTEVRSKTLYRLADFFGVDPAELLCHEERS